MLCIDYFFIKRKGQPNRSLANKTSIILFAIFTNTVLRAYYVCLKNLQNFIERRSDVRSSGLWLLEQIFRHFENVYRRS